ncbi:MAG TPA: tetratricopeptide repeat protein [Casimicrobiaceae bacterium]
MGEGALPNNETIRDELARLIDSEALRRAPSHVRLLRYLVEKRVTGDAVALRETSIALEVFRRDPSAYDPRTDPIVRVSIGRLRERLETHYSHYDAPPKVRIVLPRGSYAPEFVPIAATESAAPGIAVLRTRNASGDPALDARAAEVADHLADRLARAGFPRVIARSSVDQAQALSGDARGIGARLDVPWLVESTLSREPRHDLRLSVRLVHASDGGVRWIESAIAPRDDDRLVERMADLVTLRAFETLPSGAVPAPSRRHERLPTPARAALDRSRLLLLQRAPAATDEALALAESVVAAHPGTADGWAGVASALYGHLSFGTVDAASWTARLREASQRALALDPSQPVALRTLAIVVGKGDHDFEAAELLFTRALAAAPHYTSARLNYAELLALSGRHADAEVELNLARLHDPLSASVHLAYAVLYGYARRRGDARAAWSLCRAAGDTSAWVQLGEASNELADGHAMLASTMIDEAARRLPELPAVLVSLAVVRATQGDAAGALTLERECAARFPHYSPAQRAVPAAWRGDHAQVLALIGEALDTRDLELLAATLDPAFDTYAGESAFEALRARSPIWARRAMR